MSEGRRRGGAWLPAALAAWVPYGWCAARFWWLCDDGYISFRYARHLAQGQGLRFNPLEEPPIEGYSNLLWVLSLALGEAMGLAATWLAPLCSLICGALLILLVARHVELRLGAGPWGTWAAALFLGCLAPFGLWASGGLETMAFALAVFVLHTRLESIAGGSAAGGSAAGERAGEVRAAEVSTAGVSAARGSAAGGSVATTPSRLWALAAAVAATALLRNDGPLWAAAAIGIALLTGLRNREQRRRAWIALGVLAALLIAHTLWRASYHGDLVPNTVRIKGEISRLGLERGLRYLGSYLLFLPVTVAVATLALCTRGSPLRSSTLAAAELCVFGAALSVLAGGDFLPMGRFLVPTLPLLAVILGGGVARLANAGARSVAAGVLAAVLVLAALPAFEVDLVPRTWRAALDFRWSRRQFVGEVEQWRRVRDQALGEEQLARALLMHTRPGERLVRDAIGVVGYRTELVLLDRFGLVDREIGRADLPQLRASPGHDRAVDGRYFLDRRPEWLEAYLAPSALPLQAQVSPEFAELLATGQARVEAFLLPAGAGFPPDAQLRLVRYLPSRR
jgi:arabinofuranosyltransferase